MAAADLLLKAITTVAANRSLENTIKISKITTTMVGIITTRCEEKVTITFPTMTSPSCMAPKTTTITNRGTTTPPSSSHTIITTTTTTRMLLLPRTLLPLPLSLLQFHRLLLLMTTTWTGISSLISPIRTLVTTKINMLSSSSKRHEGRVLVVVEHLALHHGTTNKT